MKFFARSSVILKKTWLVTLLWTTDRSRPFLSLWNKANLDIELRAPASFTRSCEIKIDAFDRGQWRIAGRDVR